MNKEKEIVEYITWKRLSCHLINGWFEYEQLMGISKAIVMQGRS